MGGKLCKGKAFLTLAWYLVENVQLDACGKSLWHDEWASLVGPSGCSQTTCVHSEESAKRS